MKEFKNAIFAPKRQLEQKGNSLLFTNTPLGKSDLGLMYCYLSILLKSNLLPQTDSPTDPSRPQKTPNGFPKDLDRLQLDPLTGHQTETHVPPNKPQINPSPPINPPMNLQRTLN